MSFRAMKTALLACGGMGVLLAATVDANAGGFALREQSAFGQGSSFAGVAAGGALSSMFWNPATMTQFAGIQTESVITAIVPYSTNMANASSPGFALGGTGNTADSAYVPSMYMSYQLNQNIWLGLSVNAPFGLSVEFPGVWAGRDYAAGDSHLRTYNATPSIAYRVNDWLSVGAGVQIQYADAALSHGVSVIALPEVASIAGNGWGYGFTAGVTLTPTPTTMIGLGYRSFIDQKISGSLTTTPITLPSSGSVSTTLNLPDVVSLGIRQRISPQWTLLGTVEWTNWSRIGTSNVVGATGATVTTLPFQYEDGWFFSVGAEYQWSDRLTVRGGVAYEKSPITDDVRIPLLPDNDRYWVSVGGTYQLTPKISFDLAYSHLFVKDTSVDLTSTANPWYMPGITVPYSGTVDSHIDIVSVGLKYRFDDPAPPPASKLYHK